MALFTLGRSTYLWSRSGPRATAALITRGMSPTNKPNTVSISLYVGYVSKRTKTDEGLSLGNYPELPWRSAQELPARGWWDNQDRRNKEDPVSSNSIHPQG